MRLQGNQPLQEVDSLNCFSLIAECHAQIEEDGGVAGGSCQNGFQKRDTDGILSPLEQRNAFTSVVHGLGSSVPLFI